MSRAYDFIKDLNKDKDIWKIAVRVIDSWGVTGTNGVIHEVVKTQTLAFGKKPLFVSFNVTANMVDVTLWEAFSIQLMHFITSRQDKGPIVLLLTHAQCKLGDNGRPNFCNNWSGSKLLINFDHPDVEKFKSSYKDIDKTQGATQDFTQVSSASQISNNDPFSNLRNRFKVTFLQPDQNPNFNASSTNTPTTMYNGQPSNQVTAASSFNPAIHNINSLDFHFHGGYRWEKIVIAAQAIPSKTNCASNHDEEKHLTTGWYNFIHENNINAGHKLVFTFNQSQTILRVKIVRSPNK
ncbi:hypothetical protein P8452_13136 [Trifolium repens]|nr:hypothetical protein P8452_13136 [Trifolium repens]